MKQSDQTPQKVLFLDRDGVINKKAPPHQYITNWSDFIFLPGVFESLRFAINRGYRLAVISNQQGVGKGIMSQEDVNEIHKNMLRIMGEEDIAIDGVFYCPHLQRDHCDCRKPAPGLFYQAERELAFLVDKGKSWFIGDAITDIEAGKNYGVKTIYLNSSKVYLTDSTADKQLQDIRELMDTL